MDAWPAYAGSRPTWIFERARPGDGRFRGSGPWAGFRWNTQAHAERSRELTAAFLRHVLHAPLSSARHTAWRVSELLAPKLSIGGVDALHALREPYRLAVRLCALWLGAGLAALVFQLVVRRRITLLAELDAAWMLTATALIFFLAIGDQGEEARFLISALPLLAALPRTGGSAPETTAPAPDQGDGAGSA